MLIFVCERPFDFESITLTSLVLMHALNWDLSCLRCNFFDFVMQAKQAMQASLGIKVLGYSSFVQDCASLALLFRSF